MRLCQRTSSHCVLFQRIRAKDGSRSRDISTAEVDEECAQCCGMVNVKKLHHTRHLIYNAVPKCGSAGMTYLIRILSGLHKYSFILGSYKVSPHKVPYHYNTSQLQRLVETDLGRYRNYRKPWVYIRHLHFTTDISTTLKQDVTYVNLVRDPIERLASFYYFRRKGNKLHNAYDHQVLYDTVDPLELRASLNTSFDDCVLRGYQECSYPQFTFSVVPHFCGQDDFCLIPSQKSLSQAKRHVHRYFPAVGYVEAMGEFLQLLEKLWPQFFKDIYGLYERVRGQSHVTHRTPNTVKPGCRTREILKQRLGIEYEFYYFIKSRFHCMYKRYVVNAE